MATTNDHAYGWMQLAHRTFHAEGTTKAEGKTCVGWTCPAMGQPTCASLFAKVTNLSREHLYARLFLLQFCTQQRFREAEYRGRDYWVVHGKWKQKQEWYKKAGDADPPSLLSMTDYFTHFEYGDATSWEWIRWQEKSVALIWHTKYGVYRRKEKADVRDDPMLGQQ